MALTFNKVAYFLWGIFFGYWALCALGHRSPIDRREPLLSRLLNLGLIGLAISLIVLDPRLYDLHGLLSRRILPKGIAVSLVGLATLVSGLSFMVWARRHLGRYWSARIRVMEDHQLIRTGPYHLLRHPIYFGGLVAVLGTAMVAGQLRGLVALVFTLIAFVRKIKLEETGLRERFGSAYVEYQKRVKALVPFIY
jgi:protein-S-isoprenylcysteine O-methyltransferase Ste14